MSGIYVYIIWGFFVSFKVKGIVELPFLCRNINRWTRSHSSLKEQRIVKSRQNKAAHWYPTGCKNSFPIWGDSVCLYAFRSFLWLYKQCLEHCTAVFPILWHPYFSCGFWVQMSPCVFETSFQLVPLQQKKILRVNVERRLLKYCCCIGADGTQRAIAV